jgi:hypothetical protein
MSITAFNLLIFFYKLTDICDSSSNIHHIRPCAFVRKIYVILQTVFLIKLLSCSLKIDTNRVQLPPFLSLCADACMNEQTSWLR